MSDILKIPLDVQKAKYKKGLIQEVWIQSFLMSISSLDPVLGEYIIEVIKGINFHRILF